MDNELAKTFGEDFAQGYEQEVQKRQRQREEVSDEDMAAIASQAINGNKITPENPVFQYTTDEGITHDVALVEFPDPQSQPIWSYMNELDSGAVSIPFDYMSNWISCLFNDSDHLKKCEPGEMYIIVGEMDQWETDGGEINDQFSPARGLMSLEEARSMADESMEDDGFTDESEPEFEEVEERGGVDDTTDPEPNTSDTTDESGVESDPSPSLDPTLDPDDEPEHTEPSLPVNEITEKVEDVADQEPVVWELTADDQDRLAKLGRVISNQLDIEYSEAVKDEVLAIIEDNRDDDEEDDDESSLFG